MRFWKIIAIATASELAAAGAAAAVTGLFGWDAGGLDVVNNFAPFWFALSVAGALLALAAAPLGRARTVIVALGCVGAVLSGGLIAPEAVRLALPRAKVEGAPTRIVSFNTWSRNVEPNAAIALMARSGADVVVLIETPPEIGNRLKRLRKIYPYLSTRRDACAIDLAILSKRPFQSSGCRETAFGGVPNGTFNLVWGRTFGADGRPLMVAGTHYTWPIRTRLLTGQRRALLDFVRGHADPDMVVTGDFNLAPWSFTLKRQDSDLRPLVRADRAIFTWPAFIPKVLTRFPFALLPIDHIYAGPHWRAAAVRRLPFAGSDHYGIEATLVREAPPSR